MKIEFSLNEHAHWGTETTPYTIVQDRKSCYFELRLRIRQRCFDLTGSPISARRTGVRT